MKIHLSLALLALTATLHAQTPPPRDPSPEEMEANVPRSLTICYETFSVPLAFAAKLQREDKSDTEIHALLAAGQEKDGIRQESLDVLCSRSGQKAHCESISERIYPTEFQPPSIPVTVGVAVSTSPATKTPPSAPDSAKFEDARLSGNFDILRAPALPTASDTRNTGRTFYSESNLVNDSVVTLHLTPEHVTFVGRNPWGQGIAKAEMPTFETQRLKTDVHARAGQPILLGTISRPPVSAMDPESAQRVWFAFATVTVVKP